MRTFVFYLGSNPASPIYFAWKPESKLLTYFICFQSVCIWIKNNYMLIYRCSGLFTFFLAPYTRIHQVAASHDPPTTYIAKPLLAENRNFELLKQWPSLIHCQMLPYDLLGKNHHLHALWLLLKPANSCRQLVLLRPHE